MHWSNRIAPIDDEAMGLNEGPPVTSVAASGPVDQVVPASLRRALAIVAAVLLFILALKLLQAGAGGLRPLLDALSVDSVTSSLGFGWLGAYIVLSGSPVAAIAMALYG